MTGNRRASWQNAWAFLFYFIECRSPRGLCLKRLQERRQQPAVSDGRADIFDAFKARWKPLEELPAKQHIRLDTSFPLQESIRTLRRRTDLLAS